MLILDQLSLQEGVGPGIEVMVKEALSLLGSAPEDVKVALESTVERLVRFSRALICGIKAGGCRRAAMEHTEEGLGTGAIRV